MNTQKCKLEIPFVITQKKENYSGLYLTKKAQNLYAKTTKS